jgi:hypothetical protein
MITILSRPDTEAVTAVSLSTAGDDDPASPARSHLFDRTQLCWDRRTPRDGLSFYVVCCSLDGLVVLRQRQGLYVVCNPATGQWTNLPALPPDPCDLATIACGFYSYGSSGEYRLLCHAGYKRRSYYYVLSTGAGAVPRRLILLRAGTGITRRPWLAVGSTTGSPRTPWPPPPPANKMLAFDTASETFRLMSRPPEERAARESTSARALLEIDGELSAVVIQFFSRRRWPFGSWDLRSAEVWTDNARVRSGLVNQEYNFDFLFFIKIIIEN